jgi:ATP/maltotriose-dependent transcriptional regulator MalT
VAPSLVPPLVPSPAGDAGPGEGGLGEGVPGDYARAVYGAGLLAVQQGDLEAGGPLLASAADLAEKIGDVELSANVTDAQGIAHFFAGDLAGAQAAHESAQATYAEIGYRDAFALVSGGRLAAVCLLTGELDRARSLSDECLRRCEDLGEQWARGTALWSRGAARWLSGDPAGAIEDTLACLRIKESLGDLHTITMSIDLIAVCLADQGDYARAAELSGAGDALWKTLRAPVQQGPYYAEIRRGAAEKCREALGDESFYAVLERGTGLSVAEAIAVARNEVAAPDPGAVPGHGAVGSRGAAGSRGAGGNRSAGGNPLTKRELEIAALVSEGLGNREIAERLVLSKRTVDAHIEHIFTKLGYTARAQVAVWFTHR